MFSHGVNTRKKTNSENCVPCHAHAVVGLYSLSTEVDCGRRPMRVAVVHRDEDDIFREYVNLRWYIRIFGHAKLREVTFLVHFANRPCW